MLCKQSLKNILIKSHICDILHLLNQSNFIFKPTLYWNCCVYLSTTKEFDKNANSTTLLTNSNGLVIIWLV